MKAICVFTGSSFGRQPGYTMLAQALANCLLARDIKLVYGGGNCGLMGEVARTVRDGGGRVLGIRPESILLQEGQVLPDVENIIVKDMAERKHLMAKHSDAFISLPGGIGTLDEMAEMMTWDRLGFQSKPSGILDNMGYYEPLMAFFNKAVAEGFYRQKELDRLAVASDPDTLIDKLKRLHENG